MNKSTHIVISAMATVSMACCCGAAAQQTYREHFFAHNAAMTALQPGFPTPLVEPDPRLAQYYRAVVTHQYAPAGTATVNYGNNKGGGIVAWNRMQFDFYPPGYVQHNSTAADGFGDTTVLAKYRIASGNAEHGNFILTAVLAHTFATGSAKNGALTDTWLPTLAGGIGFLKHYDVETALGGTMPTGKIATQGRSIAWNSLTQDHISPHIWLELENNATFYFAGSHNGLMQNFVTPGIFYVDRRKGWKPTHPFLVYTVGMQIATSGFHTYNHNLIAELRYMF